jgi:hypothetical protein
MNEQVTAPTSKATSFENSRELQGVRERIQLSFVAVNAYGTSEKRAKKPFGQPVYRRAEAHSNMRFGR